MTFLPILGALVGGAVVLSAFWTSQISPLRSIPGPFFARYTNIWRLLSCLRRQPEIEQRKLHDELGPVVRLGPNMISISDPNMVPEIYSRHAPLIKGSFYEPLDLNVNDQRLENLFSTRNEELNTNYLKPVLKLYSMGYLIKLEHLLDSTINSFFDHLDRRFVQPGKPCDMGRWLEFVSWDSIAEFTFGKTMGFMDEAKDVDNIIAINKGVFDYAGVVGMMPWLDYCFERNPIYRLGPPAHVPMVSFCVARLTVRANGSDAHDPSKPDMLDGFLESRKAAPDEIQEDALMAYVAANVGAGSDTVAAELQSIVYHLCKHERVLRKLQAELDNVQKGPGPVSWATCQALEYLQACVSEGLRIRPCVGFPLERRVGSKGLRLPDGRTVLPPGTLVGMNPYVVNRDRGVFGDDAHQFRPERWLRHANETETAFTARLSRMKQTDLTYGAGKRACIGRNIAIIETHKIIASMVKTFDMKLLHPERVWKSHNSWFMHHKDIDVILRRRD